MYICCFPKMISIINLCVLLLSTLSVANAINLQQLDGLNPETLLDFAGDSLMNVCDSNPKNGKIAKRELSRCFDEIQKKKLAPESLNAADFLQLYDQNGDQAISKDEFMSVLRVAMKRTTQSSVDDDEKEEEEEDINKSDSNDKHFAVRNFLKDAILGKIDSKEKGDGNEKEQRVKVTTRDGKTTFMTQSELMARMSEQNNRNAELGDLTQDEEGRYKKESKGKKSLDEIAKDDPQLSRFIALGKWTVNTICAQLTSASFEATSASAADSSSLSTTTAAAAAIAVSVLNKSVLSNCSAHIMQLRSLPFGGSPNRGNEKIDDIVLGAEFEVWLEVSIGTDSRSSVHIEAHVQRSALFQPAHSIRVLHAWLLHHQNAQRLHEIDMSQAPALHTVATSGSNGSTSSSTSKYTLPIAAWVESYYRGALQRELEAFLHSKYYLILQCACLVVAALCAVVLVGLKARSTADKLTLQLDKLD